MKRINLFLVIVMLASILAACGSPAEPAADDGAAAPDTAEEAAAEESSDGAMAVEGEPYVDHLFATVADYEAATGNTLEFSESPMMTAMVDSGDLPAVADRLPAEPGVVRPRDAIGQFGGQVRVIGFYEGAGAFSGLTEGMQQGFFMLDPNYAAYHANIAKGWELSEDGMSLTIHLREGMKWSDGDDFTTEDIRFWHEEIVQNAEIMPNISDSLMPGGELMGLNVIDDYSFEFTFSIPYYRAVEVFAGGEYYAASHALQQYMPTYNEDAEALAEEQGYESWQQAFQFHAGTSDDYYDRDTTMPTLNPWIISEIGADSVLWTRNPYYWRVDTAGNQLPYMDEVLVIMTENVNATAPVKSLAGELDINDFGLGIDDFPVYKKGEEAGDYKVHLWPRLDQSHAMGFAFNYTYAPDEVLRELFNDLRFRQAMSLAINREEIAENVFLGLVEPYTAPVSPAWPGYEDWMGNYYGEYDVEQANALLDEMGLEWDENGEWRLRPDGETLTVPGEWATEWLAYTEDLLDLVTIHWAEIGVKFEHKFVPEDTLQTMHVANENAVGISNSDGGAEQLARGAYPIRLMPPWHWGSTGCCPMSAYLWRVWLDTEGADGIEPPDDIKRIYELVQQWLETPHGTDEYISLINEVITLNVENLYYFGTVSSPPRVWIIHNRMGNVPAEDGQLGAWGARPYLHETYYIKQ